jgi:hypothetical protein
MDSFYIGCTQWFTLGAIIACLALVIPPRIPAVIGASAFFGGFLSWGWSATQGNDIFALYQLGIFLGLIVLGLLVWPTGHSFEMVRRGSFRKRAPHKGQIFVLKSPIQKGFGALNWKEKTWVVVGPDMSVGQKVAVVSLEGDTLYVKKVE